MNRTAKQKKQRRQSGPRHGASFNPGHDPGHDGLPADERIAAALRTAAMLPGCDAQARELLDCFSAGRDFHRDFDLATEAVVTEAIGAAWQAGWSPSDLHQVARRRLAPPAVHYLAAAIIAESHQYPAATVHPRWRADLAAISAGVDLGAGPQLSRWAAANALDQLAALTVVLEVLALLVRLPRLEALVALPGQCRHAPAAVGHVDEKALGRVRALLAKAEATEFPDEAEALSAKAQDLMSRYSLHQAMVDHDRSRVPGATGRRIWIDNPYAGAKALLVQVVGTANRCRTVFTKDLGFVTVVGAETDLDLVELLATSLLVQASRAMLAAGRQVGGRGNSRTRSFRQSFLVAYATRIGERLDTTTAKVTAEVADSQLLPVLAARSRAADELVHRLFPAMVHRRVSVSDGAGWGAGRAVADLASLDVRDALAG